MRVRRQIDRHVVHEGGHVGAVIEIVAAQVILIGLAAVGMIDHRQAGRGFENFAGPRDRPGVEIRAGKHHLARQLRHHRRAAGNIGRAGLVRRRAARTSSRLALRLAPVWSASAAACCAGRSPGWSGAKCCRLCGRRRIGRGRQRAGWRRLRCRRRLRPGTAQSDRNKKHHRRKPTRCHRQPPAGRHRTARIRGRVRIGSPTVCRMRRQYDAVNKSAYRTPASAWMMSADTETPRVTRPVARHRELGVPAHPIRMIGSPSVSTPRPTALAHDHG